MRICCLALLGTVTFAVAVSPLLTETALAGGKRSACSPRGSSTEVQTSQVRVYRRGRSAVACLVVSGKRVRLGLHADQRDPDAVTVQQVRISGAFVSYVLRSSRLSAGAPRGPESLHLVDLRAGKRVEVGGVGCGGGEAPIVVVSALASSGALAWSCAAQGPRGQTVEIRKFDADGPAILDSGAASGADARDAPNVASLALTTSESVGPIAYWTRGDQARRAALQ